MSLPAVIIAQLLTIILIVNSSSSLPKLNQTKHHLSKVLGVHIAQTETPSDQPQTNPQSSPDSSPPPPSNSSTETSQPTPTEQTPTTEQPSPYSSPTPDNPSYFNDIVNPTTPSSAEQPNQSPTPAQPNPSESTTPTATPEQSSPTPQPSINPQEVSPIQTAAVLNPQEVLNSLEALSPQAIDEAKKEEAQISQTTDPSDQTKLLINFTADKVKDISTSIKNDDFSSTNFASQRFNENIDRAYDNLQKLPPAQSLQLQRQLAGFCAQADFVLRSAELSVPEEVEQDLEINRAKCLSLQP